MPIDNASSLVFFNQTVSFYGDGSSITNETQSQTPVDRMFALTDKEDHSRDANATDSANAVPATSTIRSLDEKPFDWKHYSDPNDPQFWDAGGDFMPSLPWRYFMTHPTAENAEKYKEWMNAKMKLSQKASVVLSSSPQTANSHEINQDQNIDTSSPSVSSPASPTHKDQQIDWPSYTVAFFYQTSCTYCQKSSSIYTFIKNSGAHMIPVQLDAEKNPSAIEGSIFYTKEMDQSFHVSGTPTWLFKSATKDPVRIDGYASLEKIKDELNKGGASG